MNEQKQKGGEVEKCVAYEYCKNHFIKEDKILKQMRDECVSGKNLCGECKQKYLIKHAFEFYDEFDKKFENAKKIVGKIKFEE
jgi:tryptophanyl-tRNA synthetase